MSVASMRWVSIQQCWPSRPSLPFASVLDDFAINAYYRNRVGMLLRWCQLSVIAETVAEFARLLHDLTLLRRIWELSRSTSPQPILATDNQS